MLKEKMLKNILRHKHISCELLSTISFPTRTKISYIYSFKMLKKYIMRY